MLPDIPGHGYCQPCVFTSGFRLGESLTCVRRVAFHTHPPLCCPSTRWRPAAGAVDSWVTSDVFRLLGCRSAPLGCPEHGGERLAVRVAARPPWIHGEGRSASDVARAPPVRVRRGSPARNYRRHPVRPLAPLTNTDSACLTNRPQSGHRGGHDPTGTTTLRPGPRAQGGGYLRASGEDERPAQV